MSKRSRQNRAKARYAQNAPKIPPGKGATKQEIPLGKGLTDRMQANMANRGLSAAQADLARIERERARASDVQGVRDASGSVTRRIRAPEIRSRASIASAGSGVPGSEGWNEQHRRDPARDFPNFPPNMGRWAEPNVLTFQGIVAAVSKAYLNWDQAVRDSVDNSIRMRNDTSIMECIKARQRCVALLDWHLELDGPAFPAHEALKAKMTRILKKTPHFLKYRQSLLEAIWFGKSGNQHLFGWHIKGGERNIVISDWRPINGDKIIFRMDDGKANYPRNQIGLRVGAQFKDGDLVEGRKVEATQAGLCTFLAPYERHLVCLHKHELEDAAYETPVFAGSINGVGIRSQIYWTWFQKIEFQALLMEYMERAALGFEIWYYPEGNEQAVVEMQIAARNRVGRRNFLLFPMPLGQAESQYKVDVIEPNMSGAESLRSLLEGYFGHQIKRFILGQILTSETDATGLGSSLADIHYQTLLDIVKYDATGLEESITSDTLYPLGRLNDRHFDDVDMRFVVETQSPDVMEKLDAMKKAWDMGARLDEADVLETVALSVPTHDAIILQNPSAVAPPPQPGMPGMDPTMAGDPNQQQAFGSPEEREQDLQTQITGALGGEQDATGMPPANGAPPNGAPMPNGQPVQYRQPNLISQIQYQMRQHRRRRMAAV